MHRMTVAFILCLSATLLAQAVGYHVTKTYELGGEGGWDYIVPQPSAHRVYIGRTNRVMVVDTTDGTETLRLHSATAKRCGKVTTNSIHDLSCLACSGC